MRNMRPDPGGDASGRNPTDATATMADEFLPNHKHNPGGNLLLPAERSPHRVPRLLTPL